MVAACTARSGKLAPADRHRPAGLEADGHVLGLDVVRWVPMGDAHDRLDDLHRGRQVLEALRLVGRAPDVRIGRIGLLGGIPVRQATRQQELAHARSTAELVDERSIQPRLVDAQLSIHEQAVAVEALDVIALVGRAVAPDVHAVVGHGGHQHRAGHCPPERRRVEVRTSRRRDVKRTALQRHQALTHERSPAVHQARCVSAVVQRPLRDARQVRLVVLAEVGRVGAHQRATLVHPRNRRRGVEPAREGDAHLLAGGQLCQDPRAAGGRGRWRGRVRWSS